MTNSMKKRVVAGMGTVTLGLLLVAFPPAPSPAGERGSMPMGSMEKMDLSTMKHTRAVFRVTGMECRRCLTKITRALTDLPGVIRAEVSLGKKEAVVEYDPGKVTPDKLIQAIRATSNAMYTYKAKLLEKHEETDSHL